MNLAKVKEGVNCHYHMICRKCPYHKDADADNEEYCGRSELFRDVIEALDILERMKRVREKYRSSDESINSV